MIYDKLNLLEKAESVNPVGIKNYDEAIMWNEDFIEITFANKPCQSGKLDGNEFSVEISWGNQPYMFRYVSVFLGYTSSERHRTYI